MSKYKESGVDIKKGNNFVSSIKPKVKKTNIDGRRFHHQKLILIKIFIIKEKGLKLRPFSYLISFTDKDLLH